MENTSPIIVGRPPDTPEEVVGKKNAMLAKVEPYLKSGLSIRKACLEAGVERTQLYDYMAEDDSFSNQIHAYQQYMSVVVANTIVREVIQIAQKQNPTKDDKGNSIPAKPLSAPEMELVKWYALNSKMAKEEFGDRKEIVTFDPEAELKKLNDAISKSGEQEEGLPAKDIKSEDTFKDE